MSRVYSAQLFLAHAVGTQTASVPGDQRWVIRQLTIFWPGGVGLQDVQLIEDRTSATLYKASAAAVSGYVYIQEPDLRIVLEEGSSFTWTADGSPDVGMYGYALELP